MGLHRFHQIGVSTRRIQPYYVLRAKCRSTISSDGAASMKILSRPGIAGTMEMLPSGEGVENVRRFVLCR